MSEQIVYYKKHKTGSTEYYYYVTKKGDNYLLCVEVTDNEPVTPNWVVQRHIGKNCLKISKQEAREIIKLLREGKYRVLEENYGDRDWVIG